MSHFPNNNYGYGFQQSSQQLNYPPPMFYYKRDSPPPAENSFNNEPFRFEIQYGNLAIPKGSSVRKCRARYGIERKGEWCKGCCQKKKCTRYKKNEEESSPCAIVSSENTINYPVYNGYRPYIPMVNVMLGY